MTEKHIQNRIEFCKKQIQNSIIWENSFSDESRFCMRDDSHRIWIRRGIYKTYIYSKF